MRMHLYCRRVSGDAAILATTGYDWWLPGTAPSRRSSARAPGALQGSCQWVVRILRTSRSVREGLRSGAGFRVSITRRGDRSTGGCNCASAVLCGFRCLRLDGEWGQVLPFRSNVHIHACVCVCAPLGDPLPRRGETRRCACLASRSAKPGCRAGRG
ncbi:hypothetical protein C8Q78DRAFT_129808 [Trametes maxima]|nr:hypothetical protein C8Q78DRAFT_129808 [Trametes maxima]